MRAVRILQDFSLGPHLSVLIFYVGGPLSYINHCLFPGQVLGSRDVVQEDAGDLREILGTGSSERCHNSQQPGGVVGESGESRQKVPGIFCGYSCVGASW